MESMGIGTMNGNGKSAATLLTEVQEDRLFRVEENTSATATAVAVCNTRIETLGQQMVESNAHLSEQMTAGFKFVTEQLKPMRDQIDSLSHKLNETNADVASLKADKKKRLEWVKIARGAAIAVFVAGFSAITGAMGKAIFDAITTK